MNAEARKALEELHRKSRKASIAEIGGFRPPEDPRVSWFGGTGVGYPGELLPTYRGREMFPLLQVNVEELPYVPPELARVKLLILFLNRENIPFDKQHGDGWLIREYSSLEGLVRLPAATEPPEVRPFPIRWHLSEGETPGWEDAWDLVDLTAVNQDAAATDAFFDSMNNDPGTKVGGYPHIIQYGAGIDGFVFQVGTEDKPRWMWNDNGIGYFFKEASGTWKFDCQFY